MEYILTCPSPHHPLRPRIPPVGRRIQGRHILYDFCDGVKAVWQKGFKP